MNTINYVLSASLLSCPTWDSPSLLQVNSKPVPSTRRKSGAASIKRASKKAKRKQK